MRLLPPVLVLIFAVLMVILRIVLLGPAIAAFPWNWLGLVPLAGGLAVTLTGARQFARERTNIKTFDEPTVLVRNGLFRWSRNPMYLGFALFLAGFGIALGTLVPFLVAPLFVFIADRWYIAFEERAMLRKFGAAYEAYRQSTRRWI